MTEAREYSNKIKQVANKLLKETNLVNLLEQFGEVILGGSYSYDLMVDRDLDFGLAVSSITPEMRAEIVKTFAKQSWAYKVKIVDRVNFKPLSHLEAPRGLFLGLTIPFPDERWNIDVWFMVAEHVGKDPLAKRMESATEEQKDVMLDIKYALMKSGQKEKGTTSAEIYKAVLDKGVLSTEEFVQLST